MTDVHAAIEEHEKGPLPSAQSMPTVNKALQKKRAKLEEMKKALSSKVADSRRSCKTIQQEIVEMQRELVDLKRKVRAPLHGPVPLHLVKPPTHI